MGKKYASLHIRTDNSSEILPILLNELSILNSKNKSNYNEAIAVFSNPETRRLMSKMLSLVENTNIIILSDKFISLYDENFTFENINNISKKISKKINCNIFYVANFLDMLFLMGIVKDGKSYAKRNIGELAEEYGLYIKKPTIKKIHHIYDFECFGKNFEFETSNSISICESCIEETFDIYTNSTIENLIENNNFQLISRQSEVYVFKKLNKEII